MNTATTLTRPTGASAAHDTATSAATDDALYRKVSWRLIPLLCVHSLVYRAPDGVRVSSENGVASDSWAPQLSRHNAIRRYAQATGAEVILNGNTQERSVDQYLSMVLEKEIAGTSAVHGFSNVVPSSECTPHWLFPGAPTSHLWGDTAFGTLRH